MTIFPPLPRPEISVLALAACRLSFFFLFHAFTYCVLTGASVMYLVPSTVHLKYVHNFESAGMRWNYVCFLERSCKSYMACLASPTHYATGNSCLRSKQADNGKSPTIKRGAQKGVRILWSLRPCKTQVPEANQIEYNRFWIRTSHFTLHIMQHSCHSIYNFSIMSSNGTLGMNIYIARMQKAFYNPNLAPQAT